jgi:hypothetical protein
LCIFPTTVAVGRAGADRQVENSLAALGLIKQGLVILGRIILVFIFDEVPS